MKRVAVLDDYHRALGASPHLEPVRARAEITVWSTPPAGEEELAERLRETEIVVAIRERTRFTAELLARLPALRFIAQTGQHAYHVDLDAATRQGVAVAFDLRPGASTAGTAELTFGLLLALARRICHYDRLLHAGGWELPYGRVLAGKLLGVVGVGHVGADVVHLGRAFGMRVAAWSPHLTEERAASLGAERAADLDALLAAADMVTIHVPLHPETRGLIDARRLGLLRPEALLINTSRGPIVDEAELVRLLQAGRIAGAGLDVFDREPLPADHPLRACTNAVLTPHAGWPTDQAYDRFAASAAHLILGYLDGRPEGVLNPEALGRHSGS